MAGSYPAPCYLAVLAERVIRALRLVLVWGRTVPGSNRRRWGIVPMPVDDRIPRHQPLEGASERHSRAPMDRHRNVTPQRAAYPAAHRKNSRIESTTFDTATMYYVSQHYAGVQSPILEQQPYGWGLVWVFWSFHPLV